MCASSCLCFALEQDFKRARSSLRSVLRPARAANCSGLAVSAKLCVTGHIPAVRNSLTACTWPACTAKSNGVVPSAAVKCALCSSSKRTISWWPECAASCKGLKPSLSHLCSAPASNNILTMSKCPWRAAMWSAVAPSTIGDDGSYEPSAAIRSVPIACEWSVLLMALWRGAVKLGATRKQRTWIWFLPSNLAGFSAWNGLQFGISVHKHVKRCCLICLVATKSWSSPATQSGFLCIVDRSLQGREGLHKSFGGPIRRWLGDLSHINHHISKPRCMLWLHMIWTAALLHIFSTWVARSDVCNNHLQNQTHCSWKL